jgi:hypothetical protein
MNEQAFRRRVGQHANAWRDRPRRFLIETALAALAAHAVGWATCVLTVAVAVWALFTLAGEAVGAWWATAWLGLLLAAGAAWPLARLLRLRPAVPMGLALAPGQAPALSALIDEVRAQLHAAPVHQVVLDASLGARLVERPRLGPLGLNRHTLVLGLPLMMSLAPAPLAALLAVELAPLRRAPDWRSRWREPAPWLECQRRLWAGLSAAWRPARLLPQWADAFGALFLRHFWPRFEARALVVARDEATAADRLAVSLGLGPALAQALLRTAIQQHFLDEVFWPRRWEHARHSAVPDALPLREMKVLIAASLRHPQAKAWLQESLHASPSRVNGRPDGRAALRERLALIGEPLALTAAAGPNAAEALLGRYLDGWIDTLDRHWQQRVAADWADRHHDHRQRERLLTELAEADAEKPLPLDDHLLWGRTASVVLGAAAALPIAREALARHGRSAAARHLLGSLLLDAQGPLAPRSQAADLPAEAAEGAGLLRALVQIDVQNDRFGRPVRQELPDPSWSLHAARCLERAWLQRQDLDALRDLRGRLPELEREADQALGALLNFDGGQALTPARLSARALRPLLGRLRREPAVGRAWLFAKTDSRARGWVLHLLVIERSNSLDQPGPRHGWSELRALLDPPHPCQVIDLSHPDWTGPKRMDLVQQFMDTEGGRIHARGR